MKPTQKWIALGALAVLVAGGGAFAWNQHARESQGRAQAVAALPRKPATILYPEFKHRLESAEDEVKNGGEWKEGLATVASLYHANGYTQEATALYAVLLEVDPSNGRWPNRLASIYALYGQLDQSVMLWERTAAIAPDYLPAQLNLADALIKMNRPNDAAPVYEGVLKRQPDNAYAIAGLAKIDIAAGRWTRARDRLENGGALAQVKIGENILVSVYEHLGETAKAEQIRSRAKSTDSYIEIPDPWVNEVSDDCFDAFRLTLDSGGARRMGDPTRALSLLEKAIRVNPTYAIAQYQMGSLRFDLQDAEGAKTAYRKAIELDPSYGDSWRQLIDVLKKTGKTAEADQVLTEGLARCPDSPSLHFKHGQRLKAAGRTDEAIEEFKLVARLRPAEVDGLMECASIYFEREQYQLGFDTLQKALEIMPEHPLVLSTLTMAWIFVKDQAKARDCMMRCRTQVRLPRDVLNQLATTYQSTFGQSPW